MLSIGMAAKMIGVCIKTLRRWDKQKKINCFRTIGNHRRFAVQEIQRILKKMLGERIVLKDSPRNNCALYGRVSSHKQRKRGALEAKVNALEAYCKDNNFHVSSIYKDLGSGLNTNREALWRLIRDAKKGQFSYVIVNFKDRLTRFGFWYLEEYLGEFNVKIIAVNKLENKALETELVEDLVSIIQSFSGRLYGMRSHKNKKTATLPT
jgi:putative resolvase